MEEESDSDDEIEYSGMIQPPLIKQLRTILSEYPDDGQILKVYKTNIIQVNKKWDEDVTSVHYSITLLIDCFISSNDKISLINSGCTD